MPATRRPRPWTRRLLLAALVLATPGLACTSRCSVPEPPPRGLTPLDVARLRAVGHVRVSPDGKRIAYLLSVPRCPGKDDDGPAWSELHVIGPDGTSRPYVAGKVRVGRIAWLPDGSGISYVAKRGDDEHAALYMIPVDGGESRRVLAHETDIRDYDWSPDGKRVAFIATEKAPAGLERRRKKGFKQEIYEEELRVAKVWIGAPDLRRTSAALSAAPEPAAEKPRPLDLPGNASVVRWSPAGGHLIVALAPTPLIDDHYMKRKLHVVDPKTGKVVAKLDTPGKLGQVAWSPDGAHVAVIAAADIHDPRSGRLKVGTPPAGALRDLVGADFAGHVTGVAWRDARTLVYVAAVGVQTMVAEVKVDGSGRRTLVAAKEGPILHGPSASRDGKRLAFAGDAPSHPREVMALAAGGALQRLTDSNPWLAKVALGKQEAVTYAARDGLELQGVLVRPVGEKPGQRYPLVMIVHGGPESHVPNGWVTTYSRVGQTLAARGIAAFYPNYRGSTGRGVKFSKLDQADYAGKEFNDIVDAIPHLAKMGLVDPKKVGITGGSYGGYATAWGATALSKHYAAAVMFVGISDQISKVGTTDIANEMFLVHGRRWPWENWDWFRERSPIYHAEKGRTPILILHGKADPRVHPSQSMELYRYLKLHGKVPVRLVFYPGEGHGNRRAAARYDYNLRALRWLEHYLKGPGGPPPPRDIDYGIDLGGGKAGGAKGG